MYRKATVVLLLLLIPALGVADLVDVPLQIRQENWAPYGEGSCAWASTVTALRCHGLSATADWVRANFHSGASYWDIEDMLEMSNTRYTMCDGDVMSFEECCEWMEWAMRNRHVCGIGYYWAHAINIVGMNDTHAILLDNNRTSKYIYIPREQFLSTWYYEYGGCGWTFTHSPIPPWPRLVVEQ